MTFSSPASSSLSFLLTQQHTIGPSVVILSLSCLILPILLSTSIYTLLFLALFLVGIIYTIQDITMNVIPNILQEYFQNVVLDDVLSQVMSINMDLYSAICGGICLYSLPLSQKERMKLVDSVVDVPDLNNFLFQPGFLLNIFSIGSESKEMIDNELILYDDTNTKIPEILSDLELYEESSEDTMTTATTALTSNNAQEDSTLLVQPRSSCQKNTVGQVLMEIVMTRLSPMIPQNINIIHDHLYYVQLAASLQLVLQLRNPRIQSILKNVFHLSALSSILGILGVSHLIGGMKHEQQEQTTIANRHHYGFNWRRFRNLFVATFLLYLTKRRVTKKFLLG